jgi:hypothetical protein
VPVGGGAGQEPGGVSGQHRGPLDQVALQGAALQGPGGHRVTRSGPGTVQPGQQVAGDRLPRRPVRVGLHEAFGVEHDPAQRLGDALVLVQLALVAEDGPPLAAGDGPGVDPDGDPVVGRPGEVEQVPSWPYSKPPARTPA